MERWQQACRSLPRCSGSIPCSIRCGMILAFRNSSPRLHRRQRTNNAMRGTAAAPVRLDARPIGIVLLGSLGLALHEGTESHCKVTAKQSYTAGKVELL